MTVPALEVRSLSVRHGAVTALSEVSFAAAAGDVTVLLGANGAGKSSLLRALIGLATATGDIILDGGDITSLTTEDRIRAGLAWVPEGRRVFPGMTVTENLLVACPGPDQTRQKALEEVFTLFPQLAARAAEHAWKLSGGQQQMLAIGRGLMARPKVYLLDEPALGLAPRLANAVAEGLQQISATGAAIIIAEQNAGFVADIADKTLLLRNGKLVREI
jgi:branched-chain amino acid transport system ATP-binding protein